MLYNLDTKKSVDIAGISQESDILGFPAKPVKARNITMHSLAHELGLELCNALLGFHLLKWCYSSSTHSGFGKKRGLNVLHGSRGHEWNSWENNPNSATSLQKHVKLSYVQSTQKRTKG